MGIYVLGMHRSGTSVLARVVGLLAGYQGYRGAAFDNLEGHWELPEMNQALDSALSAADADWASPPVHPLAPDDERLSQYVPPVADIIASLGNSQWVLKDPRLCLALTVVLALPQPPSILVGTFRDPSEVARSIASRDGRDYEYGLALWEIYNHLLLQQMQTSDRPATWVSYSQLMSDADACVKRLRAFLSHAGYEIPENASIQARSAINSSLRHQTGSDPSLSTSQRQLLGILQEASETGRTPVTNLPEITGWARALVDTRRPFIRMEHDNRYLTHRMRLLRPAFRTFDSARRLFKRPAPAEDPFERYS